MQILGVFVAAFVMAPILTLLHENTPGGIGGKELSAPQAGLFASLAEGFSGKGELPWQLIGIGAGLGVVILVIDEYLKQQKFKFRRPFNANRRWYVLTVRTSNSHFNRRIDCLFLLPQYSREGPRRNASQGRSIFVRRYRR